MEVVIKSNSDRASLSAALLIKKLLGKASEGAVLGLATGSTPLKTYVELIKLNKEKLLSFKNITTFNLDEYVGLGATDPNSYHSYMKKNFFSKIDINPDRCHLPNGESKNIALECEDYEEKIKAAGGIDLQILGIGQDGHIGFNEPASSLSSRTRLKTLTEETRSANSKYFGSIKKVPKHVITMGLGTILEAKTCLLLAFGKEKALAVAEMIEGPLSASVPASILQLHPRCTAIIDDAAASLLKRKTYYEEVYAAKPDWQCWD